jgi:hypothetical protein
LDRKLKEQFKIFGANDDEVWRIGEICKAVLRRTGIDVVANRKSTAFDAERFAASIMTENYSREDFRRLIGVNVFNDITWFNKEAFESALFYGKLFFVLETDSAFSRTCPERTARIAEIAEAMKKTETDCGYQLDKFIQLLSGDEAPAPKKPEPKKPTMVKKTSVTKKPSPAAKKPEAKKPAAKKPEAKKPEAKKPAPAKKPEVKTTAAKKPATKKPAPVKKPEPKKPEAKKTAPAKKSTTAKKPASTKTVKGKKRNET